MPNLIIEDGNHTICWVKTTGTGTNADPYVPDNSLPPGAATDASLAAGNALLLASAASLASIDAGIPAALGQQPAASSMPVALANEQILDAYIVGQAGQTALGNNVLLAVAGAGSLDCQQYRSQAFQIIPTGTITTGQVIFEASNDNVNFVNIGMQDAFITGNTVFSYTIATGVARSFMGAVPFRYFRARLSVAVTGAGGSVQAFTILRMTPYVPTFTKYYPTSQSDWASSSSIADSAVHQIVAAPASTIRIYITAIQIRNLSTTVGTILSILDGAVGIWAWNFDPHTTTSPTIPAIIDFTTPLRCSFATALNIQAVTTGANVFCNLQGYLGP